jgi:ParB family chromosome partitioning protein
MVARRDERIARFALGSENRGGRLKSGDDAPELVELLPVERIDPDSDQPRRHFDPVKLQELADSLTSVGQIQPIIVLRAGDRYRLHVGERRWRASQLAGLATIRAIVRATPLEARMARIAQITENEQRADLLTSELIDAIRDLQGLGLKNVEIAAALAKPPSRISELQALAAAPSALLAVVDRLGLGLSYQLLRQWRAYPQAALDFIAHMPVEHISRLTIATIGETPAVAADTEAGTASATPPRATRRAVGETDREGGKAAVITDPSPSNRSLHSRSADAALPVTPSLVGSLVVEHAKHGRGRIVFGLDVPDDHFAIQFVDATPIVAHKDDIVVLSALLGAHEA